MGLPNGSYLGFPPGAPWGDRALFPSSLDDPVDAYRLAGDLPDGWRIQVSEIAPAFGQPGGGMQVLVFNDKNKTVPVTELINAGILQ
ncbi:TNT domain-containing protein [Cellulomonas sp. JZ18]|uniref:TNT domain-containing protein n=1 Tax=Cellulomonas sp. JZ18 TaxID=2654191 RepID=UPI0018AFB8F1